MPAPTRRIAGYVMNRSDHVAASRWDTGIEPARGRSRGARFRFCRPEGDLLQSHQNAERSELPIVIVDKRPPGERPECGRR
jgi:hypothetical protein